MASVDKVGFNKTTPKVDAAAAKGGVIYFTNDTHSIFVNGKEYGMSDVQRTFINSKIEEQVVNNLNISISTDKSVYPANDGQIQATIIVKYAGTNVTPKVITGTINGTTTTLLAGDTGVYTVKIPNNITTGEITIDILVTYAATEAIVNKTATYKIYLRPNVKYCWANTESLNVSNISTVCKNNSNVVGFETKEAALSAKGTYTWTNASEGYYYLLIPTSVTTPTSLNMSPPQGVEGPLPVYFTKQSANVNYNNVEYKVYRIADKQIASTHTITFN